MDNNQELELEMQSDLEFLRGRFEELNRDIKLPHSLDSDMLRFKLENLDFESVRPKKVTYLWKAAAGLAACFVFVFGAVWATSGGSKSSEMPMATAPAAYSMDMEAASEEAGETADEAAAPQMAAGRAAPAAEMAPEEEVIEGAAPDAPAAPGNGLLGSAPAGDESEDDVDAKSVMGEELGSQEEARAVERWGAFLPQELPASLVYNSGMRMEGSLYAYYESADQQKELRITVQDYDESLDIYLVDPARPETYDLRLYEAPYADSAPEEVQTTLFGPIFQLADVTADRVAARILMHNEPGDQKYQGTLGVLVKSENILVDYSATGLEPAEVYQVIDELKKP